MISKLKRTKNIYKCWILCPLSIILIIGLLMVYSSSNIWAFYMYQDHFYYLKRQLLFLLIGSIILLLLSKIRLSFLFKNSNIILLIGFVLLLIVLVPFIGVEVNGSRSWFKIGPFLLQPSELMKIALILYTADKLAKNYHRTNQFIKTICVLLLPTIFTFLLIMLQPDFGSGIVIVGSVLMMCILCKNKFKNYLYIGILGAICFAILIITSPYRSERILSYLNPFSDPLGSGFQLIQSLYAIGPGGLIGNGFNASYQKNFFLPEPQTDFIFAVFAEDYGLIGCVILLLLFVLLIKGMFLIIEHEENERNALFKIGLANLIIIQLCINLCVVVGLIPVTGITLPFISYGGSSLIVLLACIGLLINFKGEENENIIIC